MGRVCGLTSKEEALIKRIKINRIKVLNSGIKIV